MPLRTAFAWLAAFVIMVTQGCGGGSGSSGSSDAVRTICAPAPTNSTSIDLSGVTVQQLDDDKRWVASLMTQNYLWPNDTPAVNAQDSAYSNASAPYDSLKAYFQALLSPLVISSGRKKDRYSYVSTVRATAAYYEGNSVTGLGLEWGKVADPGIFRLRYIEPDSAAARTSGLQRGDTLVKVQGVTWTEAGATSQARQLWNGGINPSTACRTTLEVRRNGESLTLAVDSAPYIPQSVPLTRILIDKNKQAVGYVHFTDYTAPAEAALIEAINRFKAAKVSDVVVDMRYNGGGYLYVANALASMLSIPATTNNKVFYSAQYGPNSGRSQDNKNFAAQACIMSSDYTCTRSDDLPHLGLARVYVLTTGSTCSASEAVINGLRGVDVQVITLGQKTCGKPYGFQSNTHNGIAYFPI
ncbi:S41 family peptidase [Limnohabitans sp.]|uniref:S41 family peptidase n=1 Tax=Limnohabitans sp. TaxID=1907725 RepID=UPI00286EC217|nr:S41 family peptidase [Limnohabitans sp.]